MPLHISLGDLHPEGYFSASFDSWYFSALCFGNKLWVVNEETAAFTELTEKFTNSVVLNRCEHSDCFLDDARSYWYVGATVGFDILVTICVQIGAVDDNLGPAMRVHWTISDLKRQTPNHTLGMHRAIGCFESVLPHTLFFTSCHAPIRSSYEVILDSEPIMLNELAKQDLATDRQVKEWVRLHRWIECLSVLVITVHVFIIEFFWVVRIVFLVF